MTVSFSHKYIFGRTIPLHRCAPRSDNSTNGNVVHTHTPMELCCQIFSTFNTFLQCGWGVGQHRSSCWFFFHLLLLVVVAAVAVPQIVVGKDVLYCCNVFECIIYVGIDNGREQKSYMGKGDKKRHEEKPIAS